MVGEGRLQALTSRPAFEALGAAALVTAAVTAESFFVAEKHVATAVAFTFLAATWALVWRRDDAFVRRCGLAFGGMVIPGDFDLGAAAKSLGVACAWAFAFAALVFVPFYFGWRAWWHPHAAFHLSVRASDAFNEVAGQLLLIALPEEAFYRGYLQTRLDEALPWQVNVAGARVGVGLLVTSAIFALGHVATVRDPARLAVFFPSLAFGWLRARTGGVGASVVFHALCNIFSVALGHGYGLY